MDFTTLILLLLIGLLAGVSSGFVGIGGGLIIVPALVFGLGLSQHMAQGTSLAMMIPPIGIFAVYSYYKAGEVDFRFAAVLAISFVLGAWLGSKWALKLNPSIVRLVFGVFMIIAATRLIMKSLQDLNAGS